MTASSIDAGGLVLGGDLGGTSTRILVTDLDGRAVGEGRAGGGNPTAHPATARDELVVALRDALRHVDPGRVEAGVLGMAGGGALRDPVVRSAYDEAWRAAGLAGVPEIRSDVEVAFAAGSDATTGTVLVAGTGAVAGRVEDGRLVETSGGHGWLLGDEGSGSVARPCERRCAGSGAASRPGRWCARCWTPSVPLRTTRGRCWSSTPTLARRWLWRSWHRS